jgi:hypothetical protein
MSDYVSEPLPNEVEEEEPAPVEEEEPAEEEAVEEAHATVEEPEPVEEEEPAPVEEEEPAEEPAPVEEEEEEPAPVEEEEEEPAPVEEEEEEEPAPVEEEEPVEPATLEQFGSNIRDILVPVASANEAVAAEVSSSSGLSDDLKQRIAELDYLRECCGNWVGSGRAGKSNFLTAWTNKSVSVDSNVNYEDVLDQLEKLPELVKLWAERKVRNDSNHFKNIESYTLSKPLFNDKSVTEKVEVVEELINLLINCANGKMRVNQIEEVIDNLY